MESNENDSLGGGDSSSSCQSPPSSSSNSSTEKIRWPAGAGESSLVKKLRLDDSILQPVTLPPPPPVIGNETQSWQETKVTIKERTSCLVNSERLSDIIFLVGQNETPIYGHKTILSAGSPYFEKLFYGPMATREGNIKIPDIEPEVFLSFLKYLYTDEFDNSADDVDTMHLLQPAKVYLVPHLADKCTELLIERISPENVLVIYNRALLFDEPRLAILCLRFLDRQIDKVIATDGFLEIDIETLATLLERQNLRVDECTLFKAVLQWTEMECQRKGVESIPINRREVLGNALYLLRYPTMTQEEFCIDVVPTGLLTECEIIGIFMNMCIGDDLKNHRPETPFSTEKRVFKPKLHYLNRFSDVLSKVISLNLGLWNSSGPPQSDVLYSSKLKFRSDQRIFLHGVGVYGISSPIPNTKFMATASICKGPAILSLKTSANGNSRSYDFRIPFQVMFDKPIEILPNEEYLLTAILKIVRDSFSPIGGIHFGTALLGSSSNAYGPSINVDSYYGSKGKSTFRTTCGDGAIVNLTFITPPTFHLSDTFSLGQIPQIIFSF